MGEIIYLNQVRKKRLAQLHSHIPVNPEDAELYQYFKSVVDGFKERGFEVFYIEVIENESAG